MLKWKPENEDEGEAQANKQTSKQTNTNYINTDPLTSQLKSEIMPKKCGNVVY